MFQIDPYESQMKKTVANFEEGLKKIRAGRANPNILDGISFTAYGADMPINQAASISVPEARLIVIKPWDPSNIKAIEQAILAANIGITPQDDGKVIRLPFPAPTEERRKEIVAEVKERGEQAKVNIRNIRRDAMDEIKKEVSDEDEVHLEKDNVQELTDKYVAEVEAIVESKTKSLMAI